MAQRSGITVHLGDPEGNVNYPEATSATVTPDGRLVVLGSRPRGCAEALGVPIGSRTRSEASGASASFHG